MKKLILFILVVTFGMIYSGCEDTALSSKGTVEYSVSCSPPGFDITYENEGGNTEQKDISSGSWQTSFSGTSGAFVYISAQANNENASISVEISFKGKVIEEATSSGDYVIATASGSLP